MPRGHPDWNLAPGQVGVSQLGDLAELAARLGSIVTYERSGSVVYLDSFEGSFSSWQQTLAGTDAKVRLSVDSQRSGGYALALFPGKDGVKYAQVLRSFPLPIYGRLGLELHFGRRGAIQNQIHRVTTYDGVNRLQFEMLYNWLTDTLSVLNQGGSYTAIATGIGLSEEPGMFHASKLVVDLATETYARLFLNETEYDLLEYLPLGGTSSERPRLDVTVFADQLATATVYLIIDDMILTQNEP